MEDSGPQECGSPDRQQSPPHTMAVAGAASGAASVAVHEKSCERSFQWVEGAGFAVY